MRVAGTGFERVQRTRSTQSRKQSAGKPASKPAGTQGTQTTKRASKPTCSTRSTSVVPMSTECRANSIMRRLRSREGGVERMVAGRGDIEGKGRRGDMGQHASPSSFSPLSHTHTHTARTQARSKLHTHACTRHPPPASPPEHARVDPLLLPHVDAVGHAHGRDAVAAGSRVGFRGCG